MPQFHKLMQTKKRQTRKRKNNWEICIYTVARFLV